MNIYLPSRQIVALASVIFAVCITCKSAPAAKPANYDESKVPAYTLPDALKAEDGTVIDSVELWESKGRPEILRLFEEHVYGTLPQGDVALRTKVRSMKTDALDGKAVRREVTVFFTDDDAGPRMELLIYTPVGASGPVPAFLGYNFKGNHALENDSSIHLSESWMRENEEQGFVKNKATEKSRGSEASRWPVARVIERGYGLVTLNYGDIDPDFDDGFRNGIHALFERGEGSRAGDAGGSISAWAWGLSRVLDVLERDQLIDAKRVAVIGHSRLGKTALWAGATDPRFAMVISNNSGCGGAALSRRQFGETVKVINTAFPHWFCLNHRQYNDKEASLPVDQHLLLALIAPRPVYVASAEEDRWADPRGEFLSLYHAGPVYELFGKTPLPSHEMPRVNEPMMRDVGYHIRTGKHDLTEYDWERYLEFAEGRL